MIEPGLSGLGRLISSPRALLIFQAAARVGSFSAAARAFNLTQPSVSRNIAQLEAELGAALFVRAPGGLLLTAEGDLLLRALNDGLQRIEAALHEIIALRTRKEVVELSLSTAFVTHWFIPRLAAFQEAFPAVDLRFQLIAGTLRGAIGNVDLAMRMAGGGDSDLQGWLFAPELILPVCSPGYLAARGTLEAPGGGHVLLHLSDTQWDEATLWGGEVVRNPANTRLAFSDYNVVLQAALSGEGVALGWITVVSGALVRGALVPAARRRVRTGKEFHLVSSRTRPERAVVTTIRAWMVEQMEQDSAHLAALLEKE